MTRRSGRRAERFRDLVVAAVDLDGIANRFARQWLAQVYLSAAAYIGAGGVGLRGAADRLNSDRGLGDLGAVLDVIFQSVPLAASGDEDRDDADGEGGSDAGPSRCASGSGFTSGSSICSRTRPSVPC